MVFLLERSQESTIRVSPGLVLIITNQQQKSHFSQQPVLAGRFPPVGMVTVHVVSDGSVQSHSEGRVCAENQFNQVESSITLCNPVKFSLIFFFFR